MFDRVLFRRFAVYMCVLNIYDISKKSFQALGCSKLFDKQ